MSIDLGLISRRIRISLAAFLLLSILPGAPFNLSASFASSLPDISNDSASKSVKTGVWTTYDSDISISGYNSNDNVVVAIKAINGQFKFSSTTGLSARPNYSLSNLTAGETEVAVSGSLSTVQSRLQDMQVNFSSNGSIKLAVFPQSPYSDLTFNFDNGHLYRYQNTGSTFFDALCRAKSGSTSATASGVSSANTSPLSYSCSNTATESINGLSAYLATVTSSAERNFVRAKVTRESTIWISASDHELEGTWRWIAGPEAGTHFFTYNAANTCPKGDQVGGLFNDFTSGEPNGTEQDAAVFNWTVNSCDGSGTPGWDDQSIEVSRNFLVEYGTTDQTISTFVSTEVIVDSAAPTVTFSSETKTANQSISVVSSESGSLYVVKSSISVASVSSITSADAAQWNAESSTANVATTISLTGLEAGTYKIYAEDSVGNLSSASSGTLTILTLCNPIRSTDAVTGAVILKFATSGTCGWLVPSGVTTSTVLVVGGGGGGGSNAGSGGGGGAVIYGTATFEPNSLLSVTVASGGTGGVDANSQRSGTSGGSSSLANSTNSLNVLSGGGAGGKTHWADGLCNSGSGDNSGATAGGSVLSTSGLTQVSSNQGASGGSHKGSNQGGNPGGDGLAVSITGSSIRYGAGGGSGLWGSGSSPSGGLDGGGAGGASNSVGTSGQANLGGGGGGGGDACRAGGAGGSGVVIINYDTATATIAGVSSSTANGTYKASETITLTVTFSETVTVTGSPVLYLNTGNTDSGTATYISGSGTSILSFRYIVRTGDNKSNLDYESTTALELNGGTINDAGGNASNLTLATPGQPNSLAANSDLVLDTNKPSTSISIGVNATNETSVVTTLSIANNETLTSVALYRSNSADLSSPTICATTSNPLNGASISCELPSTDATFFVYSIGTDQAGNTEDAPGVADDSVIRDSVLPTVETVTATTADGFYKSGDTITVTVTFSETVTVTSTPKLLLELGETDKEASYISGNNSPTLTFEYVIQSGDGSEDLEYVGITSLSGNIKDLALNSANLQLPETYTARSLGGSKSIKIDTVAPNAPPTPDLDSASDSGFSSSDNLTRFETITVQVSDLTDTATVTFTASSAGQANKTCTLSNTETTTSCTLTDLVQGSWNISVTQTDLAGNTSVASPSLTVTVDTTRPTVTQFSTSSAANAVTLTYTLNFSETVTGLSETATAFAGSTLPAGCVVSSSSDSGTAFTITLTSCGEGALELKLAQDSVADIAGNLAPAAVETTTVITLDRTAPNAPSAPVLDAGSDSGSSNSDRITNANPLVLTGTTESGSSVQIFLNESASGTSCTTVGGNYSCSVSRPVDGQATYSVKATDAAGNVSAASETTTVTVDTTNPVSTLTSVTIAESGTVSVVLSETATIYLAIETTTATVAGITALPDDEWNVVTSDSSLTTNVAATGLRNGVYKIFAVDPAGNISVSSGSVTVDSTQPGISLSVRADGSFSVDENLLSIETATATETVTWSLSGVDSGTVTLETTTTQAIINFKSSPNHEAPIDSDLNNVYLFNLVATDVAGNITTTPFAVTITDLVDTATITSIQFTSDSGPDQSYVVGDIIEITVTFSETVTVTGTPRIELQGLASRFVTYESAAPSTQLKFKYTVVAGDDDADGVSILANSLELNEGTIRNDDLTDSVINHDSITATAIISNHKVAATAPTLASSSPADNSLNVALTANISLTFSKPVSLGTGGQITLFQDGSERETFSVSSTRLSFSADSRTVTIDPTADFVNGKSYYLQVSSTFFRDSSGNFFAGISNTTTLNFTTKSTLAITISTPPVGYLGLNYPTGPGTSISVTLSNAGSGGVTYALTQGTLQRGLTLNSSTGVITGTPTETGTVSNLQITATDSSGTTATTSVFTITINTPGFRQFDNDKIRIGTATGENSVNIRGNFQQPWYKSPTGSFAKLTFSSNPLNFAFGTGTGNTAIFNGNTVVEDPIMTGQVIDYSGFVGLSIRGTNGIRGYGTIISTGTFVAGGITYELKNTFVLGQTDSSIRITTEIRNTSTTTDGTNFTFWTGTRDDWVGGTDRPTKTKGTLVGGAFQAITNAATLANVLRVTSGSEGVLFFTTFSGANSVHNSCCSFVNSYRNNPTTSLISNTNDGSYALYFPIGAFPKSTTRTFTWYYAAGSTADLATVEQRLSDLGSDTTAPTVNSLEITSNAGTDNSYKVGDVVTVRVNFSEAVNVTGVPRISIPGLTSKFLNYTSGSGTSQLLFSYTVEAADALISGLAIDANSLQLNGGTLSDASSNNAVLTHSALAASSSHKIDGVAPTLSSFSPVTGAVGVPIDANIILTFSEDVAAGAGSILIQKAGVSETTTVEQIPVNGARVTFSGNTVTINPDSNLESLGNYSVLIDSGAIVDSAGNAYAGIASNSQINFAAANASAPTITNVTATNSNGRYRAGSTIFIDVTFSKTVNVTLGGSKPKLELNVSNTLVQADYVSGSGTSRLRFEYAVVDGHFSSDLDYVSSSSLSLESGVLIRDIASSDANLTLPAPGSPGSLGANKAIIVDAVAPAVSSSSPANNAVNVLSDSDIFVDFNEAVETGTGTISIVGNAATSPTNETYSVTTSAALTIQNSGTRLVIDRTGEFKSVESITVTIPAGALKDLAGNNLPEQVIIFTGENFSAVTPVIDTQPVSETTTAGRTATLNVVATNPGLGTLTYQWYKGGVAISGATYETLTVTNATTADGGSYYVVVRNAYRSTFAYETSTTVVLTVNAAISATYESTTVSTTYGTSATSVTPSVTGGTPAYTWTITGDPAVTINSSTGVVSVASTLVAGTANVTITVTDARGASGTTSLSIVVARKSLTWAAGAAVADKPFDGTRSATITWSAVTLNGIVSGDESFVSVDTRTATALFDTAARANGKSVSVAGITLTGDKATNYSLTQPTLTGNIIKGNQSITVTSARPNRPTAGGTYTPTATSTSGLAVALSIAPQVDTSTAIACSITGSLVTFLAAGTCNILFDQTGSDDWNAAATETQTVVIGKQSQTITFTQPTARSYGDAAFQLLATSSSGLTVSYSTSSSSSICTVTNAGVVTVVGVGDCVIAANQVGTDVFSAAPTVSRTVAINPVVPTAPRIVSVSAGDERATISWTAPQSTGGSAITSYRVISQSPDDKICTTTGALSCTVSALNNGSPYTFTVTAINAAGTSEISNRSAAVTPATRSGAVDDLILIPGDGTLTASWALPENIGGGTFLYYQISKKLASEAAYEAAETQTATTKVYSGLANGSSYTIKVSIITTAITEASEGTQASLLEGNTVEVSQIPAIPPTAPRSVVIVSPTGNSATVTWGAPISNGGLPVLGYDITAQLGTRVLTCTAASATATSCFIETLTATTEGGTGGGEGALRAKYRVWSVTDGSVTVGVSARNAVGVSDTSTASLTLPSVPAKPTITGATAANGEISFTWTPPTDDGGSPITGYVAAIYRRGLSSPIDTCQTSSLTCAIGASGTIYDFDYRVRALNFVGEGLWSDLFSPQLPPPPATSGDQKESSSAPVTPITLPDNPLSVALATEPLPNSDALATIDGVPTQVESAWLFNQTYQSRIGNAILELRILDTNKDSRSRFWRDSEGTINIQRGDFLEVNTFGLLPNSKFKVWLFSDPIYLGEATVDSKGILEVTFPIPANTPVGRHNLQFVAVSSSNTVLSFVLGAEVVDRELIQKEQDARAVKESISSATYELIGNKLIIKWAGEYQSAIVRIFNLKGFDEKFEVTDGSKQIEVGDIRPGLIYTVSVSANGSEVDGAFKVFSVGLPPLSPTNVSVLARDSKTLAVNWDFEESADSYRVTLRRDGRAIRQINTKSTSVTFPGEAGIRYRVEVQSVGVDGQRSEVAASEGVFITKGTTKAPKRLVITLANGNSKLTKKQTSQLASFVSGLKRGAELNCVGYFDSSLTAKSARTAAKKRAESVCGSIKGKQLKKSSKSVAWDTTNKGSQTSTSQRPFRVELVAP